MNSERLSAVDLSDLSDKQIKALKKEAVRLRIPFSRLLGKISGDTADEMLKNATRPPHARAS